MIHQNISTVFRGVQRHVCYFFILICGLQFAVKPACAFPFRDGTTATCQSYNGRDVREVRIPSIAAMIMHMGYTGVTQPLPNGSFQITWDSGKLDALGNEAHDFLYFHECAHAHVPTSDELQANCVGLIDMRTAHRSSPQ